MSEPDPGIPKVYFVIGGVIIFFGLLLMGKWIAIILIILLGLAIGVALLSK